MKMLFVFALGAAVIGGIYHQEISYSLSETFADSGYDRGYSGGGGGGTVGAMNAMGASVNNSMRSVGAAISR